MDRDFIDYVRLVDDAMHLIVYEALQLVSDRGLPGEHHFFISFITTFPGVRIPESLMHKYPDMMTIIIRHQYRNLQVGKNGFKVTLIFNGIEQTLYIPYAAIITFADPSVQFGLQFRDYSPEENYVVEVIDKASKNKKDHINRVGKKFDSAYNIIPFEEIKKRNITKSHKY